MDLCRTCIYTDVDKDERRYFCICKNKELSNHSNIDRCKDYIGRPVEISDEQKYKVRNNRSTENTGRRIRKNKVRKVWHKLNRFSKSNSRKNSDVQRVLSGWSRNNFGCYN